MDVRNDSIAESLPNELVVSILEGVLDNDLTEACLVSKQWKRCVDTVCAKRIQKQLQLLGGSTLWQYLGAIANDEDMLDYLIERQLLRSRPPHLAVVSMCAYSTDLKALFPNRDAVFHSKHGTILTPAYLKTKAQFILESVAQYNPPKPNEVRNDLASFLKFPPEHQVKQQVVIQAYRAMESSFAVMRIMAELWYRAGANHRLEPSQITDPAIMDVAINLLCDPLLNQHLSVEGLMLLNDLYPPGLLLPHIYTIPCLVEACINRALTNDPEPSPVTHALNRLLDEMREQDWLDYLTPQVEQDDILQLDKRVIALMHAADVNHPAMLAHCTERVALRMHEIRTVHDTRAAILSSASMVRQLSDACIIKMILEINHEQFEQVITHNAVLLDRFTYAFTLRYLEGNPNPGNSLILFMQPSFLSKLHRTEIPLIAKFLISVDGEAWLKSTVFKARLNQMLEQEGQAACSDFLLSLAMHRPLAFESSVVDDADTLQLLSDEALTHFARVNRLTLEELKKRRVNHSKSTPSAATNHSQNEPHDHHRSTMPTAPTASPAASTTRQTRFNDYDSDEEGYEDSDASSEFDRNLHRRNPFGPTPQPHFEPHYSFYINSPRDTDDDPSSKKRSRLLLIIASLLLIAGLAGVSFAIAGFVGLFAAPVSIALLVTGVICVIGSACLLIIERHRSRIAMNVVSSSAPSSVANILHTLGDAPVPAARLRNKPACPMHSPESKTALATHKRSVYSNQHQTSYFPIPVDCPLTLIAPHEQNNALRL